MKFRGEILMIKCISKESLLSLADNIINNDDQVRIATLSDELTISQVVKFFDKQGKSFTKTMIQNYVRVGVIPPPLDKRYYTRNHLILLTLINSLKSIYSLEEIKAILGPILNNLDDFEDDIIKTSDVYKNYLEMRKETLNTWKESLPELFDSVNKLISEDGVDQNEKGTATSFMIALTIMAETIAMRDLISEIIAEYIKK
jgi:DNA-binding transcriptional MerR regulator